MPKAEAGTPKAIANKMKAKGLQRLRWYCQVCEKQTRDENGFKQHTMSEGHVRNMQLVGENAKSFIDDYSNQFKRAFISQLKTQHGEKFVNVNQFYQTYIAHKEHIHMNATKWPSLTEFVKYLGREKICHVKEEEKGLFVAWIDDSPEAIRRNETLRQKEAQAQGDEHREQKLLKAQIQRAQAQARELERLREQHEPQTGATKDEATTASAEPIKFGFCMKKPEPVKDDKAHTAAGMEDKEGTSADDQVLKNERAPQKLAFGAPKAFNPLADQKKSNPLKQKRAFAAAEPRKISAAEEIMKEEMERKRKLEERRSGGSEKKRMRP